MSAQSWLLDYAPTSFKVVSFCEELREQLIEIQEGMKERKHTPFWYLVLVNHQLLKFSYILQKNLSY